MLQGLLIAILVLDAVFLMVAVLLQAGTGGGLAAMGGGTSSESFLGGRQATTLLTKATWWLGGIFLGLSLVLAGLSSRTAAPRSVLEQEPVTAPAPVAPPTSVPLDLETPSGGGQGGQPQQPKNPGTPGR